LEKFTTMRKNHIILLSIFLVGFTNLGFSKQVFLPDFTSLVEKTGDAVVNITARKNARESFGSRNNSRPSNSFEKYFGIPQNPQNSQERDSVSGGSGFIISTDGYIITNRHVIHDADEITVRLIDRREYHAELIGEDESSDIALLKVDADNLPILKIGETSETKIGEWVMAIGSPLSFENSVTKGIISAKGRRLMRQQYVPYIQTDVPINRGNSGGPLINMDAEVIGVNTLILSNTGGYMGLSFSVPIDVAMSVVEQLKATGTVQRGLLGVNIQDVNSNMAGYLGLKTPKGALVTNINEGSAAALAGIQEQDVIIEFNDSPVETSSSLPPLVGSVKPGSKVELIVMRDGKAKVLHAVLDGLEGNEIASANSATKTSQLKLGFEVASLKTSEMEALGVEQGVMVKDISDRGIRRSGLAVGDVILKIAKTSIKDVAHFKKELSELDEEEPIVLLIKHAGVKSYIVIERV